MCVKDVNMCAKDAAMSAKDAAMCAKDAHHMVKGRACVLRICGHVLQGRGRA